MRICVPSMGATLRVQIPRRRDHLNRSEPQARKGDRPWAGSGERNRASIEKRPIEAPRAEPGGEEEGQRGYRRDGRG